MTLHRKFAVIKHWPELNAAEDECIARIKKTSLALGIECLEVDSFARLIPAPHTQLTRDDVDFILSLHFETPKCYDIFSFVALWNPLQFYHEWGYRRCTNNLLTHDDFLSCSSPWADDHVKRCIANDPARDDPYFSLYHSLSDPILDPAPGEGKLFYSGINWEKITKTKGRHHDLLKLLDKKGLLRIYGPRLFQKVNVWSGYKCYVGPVPFDGVTIIRLIHKAGISLCLSSEAHRQSELMSSRLFEALAAGAVVICDENPFGRKFFGDSLLYIDTKRPVEETAAQIESHVEWIRAEPERALELARRAQAIFRDKFLLDRCIETIYRGLPARKEKLASLYRPATRQRIAVFCLMPEYDPVILERHITSCLSQNDVEISPVLILDRRDNELFGRRIQAQLDRTDLSFTTQPVEFFERFPDGSVRSRRRNGEIVNQLISGLTDKPDADAFICIVSPGETLFSDHLSSLLAALQGCEDAGAAVADMVCRHKTGNKDHADLADDKYLSVEGRKTLGFGRFLFRRAHISSGIGCTLVYLDSLTMHLLVGTVKTIKSARCTLMLDTQEAFTVRKLHSAMRHQEREILKDFAPDIFGRTSHGADMSGGDHLVPLSLSLKEMDLEKKRALAVELAHCIPFPAFMSRIGFGVYRFWLRFHRKRSGPEV